MKRLISVVFFGFVLACIASAQFNIKIAYTTGYGNFGTNNSILSNYNQSNDFLEDKLESLHILHGIQIGGRYRWKSFGIELSWENLNRKRESFGEIISTSEIVSKELFYSVKSLSAGLENYFGRFGYGAAFEQRSLRIKTKVPQIDKKREILKQSELSARFYLIFELQQSNFVSLALKPYVQFPLAKYDLSPLKTELLGQSSGNKLEEDLMIFGLTIAFYNGPQN